MDRQVRQYQVSEYEKGQRATDYTTWLTSSAHYSAKFEEVRPQSSPASCLWSPVLYGPQKQHMNMTHEHST